MTYSILKQKNFLTERAQFACGWEGLFSLQGERLGIMNVPFKDFMNLESLITNPLDIASHLQLLSHFVMVDGRVNCHLS